MKCPNIKKFLCRVCKTIVFHCQIYVAVVVVVAYCKLPISPPCWRCHCFKYWVGGYESDGGCLREINRFKFLMYTERAFYCLNEQFVSNITADIIFSTRSSERFGNKHLASDLPTRAKQRIFP